MKISDFMNRNMAFYMLIIISLIYILVANQIGGRQDDQYFNDNQQYQTATNLINQQRFIDAQPILTDLKAKYNDSYVILWQYAISMDGQGYYKDADQYYALTERIRPFIVKTQYFLVQRGTVLYRLGNYKEAKKYLTYSTKINTDADLTSLSEKLLKEIEKKS